MSTKTKTKKRTFDSSVMVSSSVTPNGLCYVLRVWDRDEDGTPKEWVTHMLNTNDGSYVLGHYFYHFDEAAADFKKRCETLDLVSYLTLPDGKI